MSLILFSTSAQFCTLVTAFCTAPSPQCQHTAHCDRSNTEPQSNTMKLDTVASDVLTTLCWCVRNSSAQLLACSLSESASSISRSVRRLVKSGLALTKTLPLVTFEMPGPLYVWNRDCPSPEFSQLEWRLFERLQSQSQPIRLVWATKRAAGIVGGVAGASRQPLQVQHDYGMARVYATRRMAAAQHRWIGEDAYRACLSNDSAMQGKLPDAVILSLEGTVERVIELGGRYTVRRLQGFHRYWSSRDMAYEIW